MKGTILVGLVCVNAALVVALAAGPAASPAYGQLVAGRTEYLVLTGQVTTSNDVVYITDLGSRTLAVIKFDKQNKRLVLAAKRNLGVDFQRKR